MSNFDDALFQSVAQTFFDMAKLEVIPTESVVQSEIKYSSVIVMEFMLPEHGQLQFFLPRDCKQLIVESIYSENWKNLSAKETDDCLLELVNVATGSYLGKLYPDQPYKMNLPALYFDDSGLIEGKTFYFKVQGIPFMVSYGLYF